MSALLRMLVRDAWHLRGQVLACALVAACGVATLLAMRGTYHSLLRAQAGYYQQYRLADVFAQLRRAPRSLAESIRGIEGVAAAQVRVVRGVTVDIPGLDDPATARLIGLGTQRPSTLNQVHLVAGRFPAPGRADEVVASSAFTNANGLHIGDRIGAIVNGRWRQLRIVGTAMSPEFVYEVAPGSLLPDNRRYGVLWMDGDVLDYAFDMRGAFNDVSVVLERGASQAAVIDRLDRLLQPYGGLGAYGRDEHPSHRFVADELAEIEVSTRVMPTLFLAIAAFLVYMTLARIVTLQRAEIGLLKAFGYGNLRVGWHYLRFALLIAALGLLLGVPAGMLLARYFLSIYREYFHFPALLPALPPAVLAAAIVATVLAAALGAISAVLRSLRLTPADAMKPLAPVSYRPGLMARLSSLRRLRPPVRMVLRSLARRPLRAMLTTFGVSCAVALMVAGRFSVDAVAHLLEVQFGRLIRSDLTVTFNEPAPPAALLATARLQGVLRTEGFRSVPVWLRHGSRAKRVELTGIRPDGQLRQVQDAGPPYAMPPHGVVLGRKLAQILDVTAGGIVGVEVIQGARLTAELRVMRVVEEYLGLNAYMDAAALSGLLREDASVSGAYLRSDPEQRSALNQQLKRLPAVAGVMSSDAVRASVQSAMDRSFLLVSAILTCFAATIVLGIVYNTVRIALSERAHELASLRVLGFTEGEVRWILLGEQAVLSLLAIPLGLALGYALCAALVPAFDRETFRLPLVVSTATLLQAALVTVVASWLSGLLVARRLRRLDLIEVLKARE